MLPDVLKNKVPPARDAGTLPVDGDRHPRQVLMLAGCVQPAMMPTIDAATMRVLDALGIGTKFVMGANCCGAIGRTLATANSDAAGRLSVASQRLERE